VETVSVFRQTLRVRVDDVAQAITEAQRGGHDYAAHLYQARLEDLLEIAARNDVDTSGWVDPAVLEPATYGD
jgi:hypothetical protein